MHKIRKLIVVLAVISCSMLPLHSQASLGVCPVTKPLPGPSYGNDLTDQVPTYYPNDTDDSSSSDDTSIGTETYENAELGKTASPAGKNYTASFNSCHGKTPCHPSNISGHGVYKNRDSLGDAVDLTPSSGKGYAAFDGTAYKVYGSSESSSGNERDGAVKLVSTNGQVVAYYYHTFSTVKSGQSVSAGQVIARTGANGYSHIHFELLVNGKSVHGDLGKKNNDGAYVRSLWANMKKVLGI